MKVGFKSSVIVCLIAVAFYFRSVEIKAALGATALQTFLYANAFGALPIFGNGFSYDQSDDSILPVLDMGYTNMLQIKLIYLSRFIFRDQFLFNDYANLILLDIEQRLEKQFKANKWDFTTFNEIPVPSVQYSQLDTVNVYEEYTKKGIPFVVKGTPSAAVQQWSPDFFAAKYGSHEVSVINTTSVGVVNMNLSEFVNSQQEGNKNGVLYIRALSDIFDKYPELVDDVGYKDFSKHVNTQLITAQIFMGMSRGSGTSYHCANFNNLFFQINGRKKWTFVSPRYNALMYPMFNEKSMDVASFLTVIALSSQDIMDTYFPLYKYAPKMVAVLEPGDVLFNPPWHWHMIDNLETNSIGVASRWMVGVSQHYQNTVHSNLQFLSAYIWTTYFSKMVNLQLGTRAHAASNTPPMDERFDFGKEGSARSFVPRIFPDSVYEEKK